MAVLLTVMPETLSFSSVLVQVDAEALLQILHVLSRELAAVWPAIRATPMDKRVLPHTAELAPILAEVVAITRCGICLPLARIEGSVWPGINTVAMLLAE